VIRLAPPLTIDKADLDWGLNQVREVLEPARATVAGEHPAALAGATAH
jgi:acetylornithine/succinyldiaminopimelate/putrescine aminotransferase